MNTITSTPSPHDISVELHPLQPFLPPGARVLMLGSFPPQAKRWCMPFFYPNYNNDHWRIVGAAFYGDRNHFVDTARRCFRLDLIKAFATQAGIGYYDTATAVRRLRDNASDHFLQVVTPTDIVALTAPLTELRVIGVTGQLATSTLCATLGIDTPPAVGESVVTHLHHQLLVWRLPSSSRAYPLAFDRKVEAYATMFRAVGLLGDTP